MVTNSLDNTLSRDISHPNLIEINQIPSKFNSECSNIAVVRAMSTKPTKSLIWISAKDKRKHIFLHIASCRLGTGPSV
jgi:hypothetical protein